MAGLVRYPTKRVCRSGLSAITEGPPAAGTSACGVSPPVSGSTVKTAILSSSCRQTYREQGIVHPPWYRSWMGLLAHSAATGSRRKRILREPSSVVMTDRQIRSARVPMGFALDAGPGVFAKGVGNTILSWNGADEHLPKHHVEDTPMIY